MEVLAGSLVLVGAALLLVAGELVDDLFLAGLASRACRGVAPRWMRGGVRAMVAGAGLVVAGLALLHIGS